MEKKETILKTFSFEISYSIKKIVVSTKILALPPVTTTSSSQYLIQTGIKITHNLILEPFAK